MASIKREKKALGRPAKTTPMAYDEVLTDVLMVVEADDNTIDDVASTVINLDDNE